MAEHRMYQVDAFADRIFRGNPAAVVPLEGWLPDDMMQAIAEENRLSETAFFVPTPLGACDYHLRWFTPAVEVELCGHATLASSWVLWHRLGFSGERVSFESRSGPLAARRDGELIELDFPSKPFEAREASEAVIEALAARPSQALFGMDLLCVFDNERDVLEMAPNFGLLADATETRAVIVTAPGRSHDFVSRVFAPKVGINEDPVTGSAHCLLAPYWGERLDKSVLSARQASRRGGEIRCTLEGDRVLLAGKASPFLEGVITLP
ncbi:MAG: PhzF family phenazine biosynthesis protein [Planctomycetota bacterium]